MSNEKVSQKDLYDTINDFRKEVNQRFDKIEDDIAKKYVTREEFLPVKAFVDKGVAIGGLILLGILGLIISHVIPGFKL